MASSLSCNPHAVTLPAHGKAIDNPLKSWLTNFLNFSQVRPRRLGWTGPIIGKMVKIHRKPAIAVTGDEIRKMPLALTGRRGK